MRLRLPALVTRPFIPGTSPACEHARDHAWLDNQGDRLPHFKRHDSLLLLRYSFAIPRILYLLRTSPCFRSSKLEDFNVLLRSITSEVLNINLDDETVWLQASFPVSSGGLGVRSAVQLAPSAFLASAAGCLALTKEILPPRLQSTALLGVEEGLILWKSRTPVAPPSSPSNTHQKAWDVPRVRAVFELLLEGTKEPVSRARLLGASAKESGAWLNAPPVSSLGLRLDDDSITISVGLRLGVPICRPHMCRQCGAHVDKYGLHGLSCRKSQGRHPRHNAINGIIHRSLTAAGVPCQVEPQGLSRNDGKRPDGVTLLPWRNGRPLIWDATCSDTFAPTYSSMASVRAGAVADATETRKAAQYHHLLATHIFAPVAIETSGNFGSDTHLFLKEISKRLKSSSGEALSHQFLLQRLSVAVQRGNTLSILGTMQQSSAIDDIV